MSAPNRTELQARQIGAPFVEASGILSRLYHQNACSGAPCRCRLSSAINRLSVTFTDLLDEFGSQR